MNVKVINKSMNKLPEYKTSGSAGMDLMSNEDVMLMSGEVRMIPTGLSVEIPQGYEAQVRSRSGLALQGLVVNNAPGTIDSDFRGEIMVIMKNQSDFPKAILTGDRIAQLVFARVEQINWVTEEQLSDTMRGIGGFGSTGMNDDAIRYPLVRSEQTVQMLKKRADVRCEICVECLKPRFMQNGHIIYNCDCLPEHLRKPFEPPVKL